MIAKSVLPALMLLTTLAQTGTSGETWEWVWKIINSLGVLGLGGVITQYVVPRMRRLRESADTAKTKAEAGLAEFAWYKEQLKYLQDRVDDLETTQNLSRGLMGEMRRHIDDLYASISQEAPEVQARIKGRLTTKRPNGIPSGNGNMQGVDRDRDRNNERTADT